MSRAVITMPAPPSVNNLFKNLPRGGRVPTAAYDAWKDRAGWAVKAQRPQPVYGPVSITIEHGARRNRVDTDNLFKAPLDLLVKLGLIEDDNDGIVRKLVALTRVPGVDGCRITIEQMEAI